MSVENFQSIVMTIGFPSAFLAAFCWMGFKAGSWMATNVIKPLVDSTLKMQEEIVDGQQSLAESYKKLVDAK